MRASAEVIGTKLNKWGMLTCLACTVGNSKQKNAKKTSKASVTPGGYAYLDISTVNIKKEDPTVTNPNWRIMVVESTDL
jgi:hypothetical protein